MRKVLGNSAKLGDMLDMMYMAKDDIVSKRHIKVTQVGELSIRAYLLST